MAVSPLAPCLLHSFQMASKLTQAAQYGPAVLALLLPAILVYSAIRTFQEVEQMRQVFLRDRGAAIAARLETIPELGREGLHALMEDEPGLTDVQILAANSADPSARALSAGDELFRTEFVTIGGRSVLRIVAPFHQGGQLRIVRIDLDAASADFLLVHARHNVAIATVSSVVLLLLTAFAVWSIRRQAEQDKKRLELTHLAHLGKLSAVLAHEIRNPLGTIKGFTQLAIEQADARSRTVLEPVLREALRLERLVNDLLLYGRPPQPVLSECSWQEFTADLALCSGCRIEISASPIRFRTDAQMLRQILNNLIRNSCEALVGRADGKVAVSAQVSGADVAICIDDNGPGIPDEQREKVFESFYTTKSFGTGLGLPIATSLTAALGGAFSLSARPSGGLRAEVRLPCAVLHEPVEVKS